MSERAIRDLAERLLNYSYRGGSGEAVADIRRAGELLRLNAAHLNRPGLQWPGNGGGGACWPHRGSGSGGAGWPHHGSGSGGAGWPAHGGGAAGLGLAGSGGGRLSPQAETPAPVSENTPTELLPCPFCGGAGRIWQQARGAAVVGCETGSHHCAVQPHVHAVGAEAITAWNTRAPILALRGEGEAKAPAPDAGWLDELEKVQQTVWENFWRLNCDQWPSEAHLKALGAAYETLTVLTRQSRPSPPTVAPEVVERVRGEPETNTPAQQTAVLREALGKRCYVHSGQHLSGYAMTIGFETLKDVQAAHDAVARPSPPTVAPEVVEGLRKAAQRAYDVDRTLVTVDLGDLRALLQAVEGKQP